MGTYCAYIHYLPPKSYLPQLTIKQLTSHLIMLNVSMYNTLYISYRYRSLQTLWVMVRYSHNWCRMYRFLGEGQFKKNNSWIIIFPATLCNIGACFFTTVQISHFYMPYSLVSSSECENIYGYWNIFCQRLA